MTEYEWAVVWQDDEVDGFELEPRCSEESARSLAASYPQWDPLVVRREVTRGPWEESV